MKTLKNHVKKLSPFTLGILCLFSSLHSNAQSASEIKAVVDNVADLIIQNTSYGFVNKKTGEHYSATDGIPELADIKSLNHYTTWYYPYGVMATGMVYAGKVFHERKYIDYASRNYKFIFKNLDYFRKKYESGNHHVEYRTLFRMHSLDDCGAMAAGLVDVYKADSANIDPKIKKEFLQYINQVGHHILNGGEDTLSDGTFCRPWPRKMTIWGDDLYMGGSMLARMGNFAHDKRYFDFAIKQVENFNKHLYDERTGLFFHCWYTDVNMNGVAHWGRANGWLMFAQVALLNNLPDNYPGRENLIHLLLRQIVGVSRYQDPSGLWHQLLDKPDSYLETSCTAMFVYSIAKAVNEGWIPERYLSVAKRGWRGLESKINARGAVEDVCIGTGIQDDIAFYYNRPHPTEDSHVFGPVLLAGAELYKAVSKK